MYTEKNIHTEGGINGRAVDIHIKGKYTQRGYMHRGSYVWTGCTQARDIHIEGDAHTKGISY